MRKIFEVYLKYIEQTREKYQACLNIFHNEYVVYISNIATNERKYDKWVGENEFSHFVPGDVRSSPVLEYRDVRISRIISASGDAYTRDRRINKIRRNGNPFQQGGNENQRISDVISSSWGLGGAC